MTAMREIARYERGDALLEQANALDLHIASKDRRIIGASGKMPFRDYTKAELMETIAGFLPALFRQIGISKQPDQFDFTLFYQTLLDWFPEFTLADIRNAFTFYLMGEMDGYVKKDLKHFQSFSMEYYSPILRGYRQKQREVIHDVGAKVQLITTDNARHEAPGVGRLVLVKQLRKLCTTYLEEGVDHFIIHDILISTFRWLKIVEVVPEPTKDDFVAVSIKASKGYDNAVAAAFRKSIEAGAPTDDIRVRAERRAYRKEMLQSLWTLGADELSRRFDWAEANLKTKYNLQDETVQKED